MIIGGGDLFYCTSISFLNVVGEAAVDGGVDTRLRFETPLGILTRFKQ